MQQAKWKFFSFWERNNDSYNLEILSIVLCSTVILTGLFPQCEENANLQDSGRYLKLPFSKGISLGNNSQAVKTTKESFWITSFLCSTKLTQNGRICWFFKTWWAEMSVIASLFHAKQAWMYSKIAYVLSILWTGFLHNFFISRWKEISSSRMLFRWPWYWNQMQHFWNQLSKPSCFIKPLNLFVVDFLWNTYCQL